MRSQRPAIPDPLAIPRDPWSVAIPAAVAIPVTAAWAGIGPGAGIAAGLGIAAVLITAHQVGSR